MKLRVGQYRDRKIGYIIIDGKVMVSAMDVSRYPTDNDPESLYFISQRSVNKWEHCLGTGTTCKENVVFGHWKGKRRMVRAFLDALALVRYLRRATIPSLLSQNTLANLSNKSKKKPLLFLR